MEDPDEEVESLFEALVQPLVPPQRSRKRIDGAITNALGAIAGWLPRGATMPAFGGTHEPVLRGVSGVAGTVVVEGVNLAASSARRDADALVSKLLRIIETPSRSPVHIVVGYVTSPGGLNGETDMRDWIRAKITPNTFDVIAQGEEFKSAAQAQLAQVGVTLER